MKISFRKHRRQQGFTFVEIAVIAPIVILAIGAFITVVVNMTGKVLISRSSTQLQYNVQDALNRIDQDVKLSSTFLAETNIALTSPQGYGDDTTVFDNVDNTKGAMLILNTLATTGNPLDSSSAIAYLNNSPNPCGTLQGQNTPLTMNVVYFVKNNTLWRRTIAPANYATAACNAAGTGTAAPWQIPSCSAVGGFCKTQDEDLVDGVSTSGFSLQYYSGVGSTSANTTASSTAATVAARNNALSSVTTVVASIDAHQTVASQDVEQSASIRSSRLDINATAIAPPVQVTTPAVPQVKGTFTSPNIATFSWLGVSGGGNMTYTLDYNINGGSWTNAFTGITNRSWTALNTYNGETINVRVLANNGTASAYSSTATVTIPVWIPFTLQNNWSNYGNTYTTAAYSMTSTGMIVLKGLITGGTASSGYVIGNLPAGYRPAAIDMFGNSSNSSVSGNGGTRVDIRPNGDVVYQVGGNSWYSLDGINFMPSSTSFTAVTAFSNGWVNYNNGFATAGYYQDGLGRVHLNGLIGGGSTTDRAVIFNLSSTLSPTNYLHIGTAGNNTEAAIGIAGPSDSPANNVNAKAGTPSSYLSLQAMFYPSTYTSSYTALTLTGGWGAYGNGYSTPAYIKSADNVVMLKGLINAGSTTAGTVLATLPAGYRPAQRILYTAISNSNSGNPGWARIDILPNGQVQIQNATNGWLSLDNVSFIADQ